MNKVLRNPKKCPTFANEIECVPKMKRKKTPKTTVPETPTKAPRRKNKSGGRPKVTDPAQLFTFRAKGPMAQLLKNCGNRTEFIHSCIQRSMADDAFVLRRLGDVYPADKVEDGVLPQFDIRVQAGFPVPLDNDERSQDIHLLDLLCPHPESSYLIRVEGDSMIDADIHGGDIVIVDKSNRNPTEQQVAVCEYNGEYTLKRFRREGEIGWLVPANPAFPEIRISPDDSFCIWGTVTYVIHKPKG